MLKTKVNIWVDKRPEKQQNNDDGLDLVCVMNLRVNPSSPWCSAQGQEMTEVWFGGEWVMLHDFQWCDGANALYVSQAELDKHNCSPNNQEGGLDD